MAKNEYLQAIKSVGNILQYYDSDKQFPVYGFVIIVESTLFVRVSLCILISLIAVFFLSISIDSASWSLTYCVSYS